MRRIDAMRFEFVEHVPEGLEDGMLYISMRFATAIHRCCCGCGSEVVTPLSPTDWKLIFDGETVSLDPSIGNWGFACRAHYWIVRNRVRWAKPWSPRQIAEGRDRALRAKEDHLNRATAGKPALPPPLPPAPGGHREQE